MKEEKKIIAFTTIHHRARKELDISLEEYCVADAIYHLSNNPKSKIYGWCYSSKKYIADFIKIGEKMVFRNINNLISKKIIEKDEETKYLKTTSIWYEKVVIEKVKEDWDKMSYTRTKCPNDTDKMSQNTRTKCPNDWDKMSHDNNKIVIRDKERDIKEENSSLSLKESSEKEIKDLAGYFNLKINPKARLLEKAGDKIKARIKKFSPEEIKKAIDNFSKDKWKMENLSDKGIAWFFHSDERVEGYVNLKIKMKPNNNASISSEIIL